MSAAPDERWVVSIDFTADEMLGLYWTSILGGTTMAHACRHDEWPVAVAETERDQVTAALLGEMPISTIVDAVLAQDIHPNHVVAALEKLKLAMDLTGGNMVPMTVQLPSASLNPGKVTAKSRIIS
jgi:hypothetical protein